MKIYQWLLKTRAKTTELAIATSCLLAWGIAQGQAHAQISEFFENSNLETIISTLEVFIGSNSI